MRLLLRVLGLAAGVVLLVAVLLAADIALYAGQSDGAPADAAIVLGAAVADDQPTPVFEERLRHAVELYRSGQVRLLVMTGGTGPGDALAESEAGRDFAIANGVPADAIVVETASRTTRQNLVNAVPLLLARGIDRVLVVSDPLHMRRAIRMATDLGLDAHPSPTPSSRYRSLGTQVPMLGREAWFTFTYLLNGQ
jgi:uncharacterized SAM-binding protein YcdF (DUF218 family)